MPLRIGICAPYDLARDGGVNSHIRAQARALRDLGHTVRVFGAASGSLSEGETAVSGCITAVIGGTDTPIGLDPRAWVRVARLYARECFDLVHVHEPLMPLVPWCAVLRARAPVVATFHAHREEGHRFYPRANALLAPLMNRVSARVAVSNAARQTVADAFPGSYAIVPNGVDIARFTTPRPQPDDFAPGRMHVLCVGRLEPRKGVVHLIRAAARIASERIQVRLVIAGDGPDREPLETLAQQLGIDTLFAGRLGDEQLIAWYQHADIVCAPAVGRESFGIVLLEAMGAGRPVVATAIDGYRELVGDLEAVRLVPAADASALADGLVPLLRDATLRERLGAAGRMFVQRFDWTAIARRLEAVYLDALRSSSPGSQMRSRSTK